MFKFFMSSFAITFVVKLSGLIRDVLLFYNIGVNSEFDTYITILVIPSIFLAVIIPFINLGLTPKLKTVNDDTKKSLMAVLFYLSLLFTIISIIISYFFVLWVYVVDYFTVSLILLCSVVILFSVLAEFSCSVLISERRLQPIYLGNLFINLPVIFYFLFNGNSVLGFAIVSAFSYAFRFIYLNYFIYGFDCKYIVQKSNVKKETIAFFMTRETQDFKSILIGPAFQILMYVGRASCILLPTGSASLYYYGFKLFDAFKGTIWFVVITSFFSNIQFISRRETIIQFYKISSCAFILSFIFFILILFFYFSIDDLKSIFDIPQSFEHVIYYSIFSAGLIFLVPIIDLYQRFVVTFEIDSKASFILLTMIFSQLGLIFTLYLLNLLLLEYVIFSVTFALLLPVIIIFYNIKIIEKG